MGSSYTKLIALIGVILAATATAAISTSFQRTHAILGADVWVRVVMKTPSRAPIATSGDKDVYITWWTNQSGNWDVFFRASTDGGKTFGPKINLSNSKGVISNDAEIAAAGSNVYLSWWERANATSNEPVLKISNDNGKTFGPILKLSANGTTEGQ
jgi:hypothetical protein